MGLDQSTVWMLDVKVLKCFQCGSVSVPLIFQPFDCWSFPVKVLKSFQSGSVPLNFRQVSFFRLKIK